MRPNERIALETRQQAKLFRRLSEATRVKDPVKTDLEQLLLEAEEDIGNELRRPSDADITSRVRHMVWPVGAIIIT